MAAEAEQGRREWSREDWIAYADRLLDAARRHATPGGGRIHFPGTEGGYGHDVDGLEGFARTLLLAGFRIAGARGEGVDDLIAFVRRGIAAGVDPAAPDRWVRPDEHGQAKVEAASLALVLDLTRPWVWDTLDAVTRERAVDWFSPVVGDEGYPRNNWVWFRIVVQTFLRSVGGPWSPDDIAADLARHDSFVREDGWLADGDDRSYDHYVGWALHTYPVLWSRMSGAAELAASRTAGDIARLDRFLDDALALVGGDGSPLVQGRSLIYRYAAAAAFWVGAIAEVPSHAPGRLRHAAEAVVRHFADRGVPDAEGVLTMGWHGPWRALAQSYSGPGSPYWAVKGLMGLMLPADHPVWTAPAEPLPVERGDVLRAVRSPGWIVSGTRDDGVVRVLNHGTDHAQPGAVVTDSPLYTRIGYATATAPLLDARAWHEPLEQSVALRDADGRATHRAGMRLLDVRVDGAGHDAVGVASAVWDAHWITGDVPDRNHGSGFPGDARRAGRLRVDSLVRGSLEVRLVRVEDLAAGLTEADLRLRVGGWAVAGGEPEQHVDGLAAVAVAGVLRSGIRSLSRGKAHVVTRTDAGPLGTCSAVPVVDLDVAAGRVGVVVLDLRGAGLPVRTDVSVRVEDDAVEVVWADGVRTSHRLSARS
ncbi:DUF2264 domain-containing protein [Microbacterium sp. KSW4-11]|uniref:DUF2264 domain-containing protein n=1 Tax=Microbacterium gawkjiense TaxID=3067309 RepID=A0ABU3G9M6_9MICO|nr:DUF2264 domain-containing protein [Microbacterium sp. KSW4-11]MDT3316503.1 DUF2264 domain-containing protein [Microbacterium sp. KSW4-11]